jgi:hypothetical protein
VKRVRAAVGDILADRKVHRSFVKLIQQSLLRHHYCLRVQRGNFGCGVRLLDGPFGLGGEKGAIAGGVGVALGDRGRDARGSRLGRARCLRRKVQS